MTGKHVASAVIILFLLLNSANVFAIQQLMAFQGKVQQNGSNVTSGDLQVLIYSASAGGILIYDSGADYNSTISDGYFDAMLGDQTDLDLNYGQFYYLDMLVNGVDLNFSGSERKQFYSSIGTNIDTNSHFVPYIGADYDTNLGIYGLTAEDINAMKLGIETDAHILGRTYTAGITSITDSNFTNIGISGIAFMDAASPKFSINATGFDNPASLIIGRDRDYPDLAYEINFEPEDTLYSGLVIRGGDRTFIAMGKSTEAETVYSMDLGAPPGTINFTADSNAINMEVAGTLFGDDDLNLAQNVGIAGNLYVIGNLGTAGTSLGIDSNFTNFSAANAWIEGDLNVAGKTTMGDLNAVGDANFEGNVAIAGTLFGASPVKIAGGLAVKGTTTVSGLVGIGTSSPSSELDVAGRISGTVKDFRITHPLDESMFLVHSTLEGPEIAVFYRGESQLQDGAIAIELPEYFEALARKEGRTVLLTPKNGWSPLYVDGDVENNAFTVRTTKGGNPSQEFFWEVKAVRADIAQLQVEVLKTPEQMQEAIEKSLVFARHDEAPLNKSWKELKAAAKPLEATWWNGYECD